MPTSSGSFAEFAPASNSNENGSRGHSGFVPFSIAGLLRPELHIGHIRHAPHFTASRTRNIIRGSHKKAPPAPSVACDSNVAVNVRSLEKLGKGLAWSSRTMRRSDLVQHKEREKGAVSRTTQIVFGERQHLLRVLDSLEGTDLPIARAQQERRMLEELIHARTRELNQINT